MRKHFTQRLTLLGTIVKTEPSLAVFTIRCRSEDEYLVHVAPHTQFQLLQHLDGMNRDYFPIPGNVYRSFQATQIQRYICLDRLVCVEGIWQEHQDRDCFTALTIHLFHDLQGNFLWERERWWLDQTICLTDTWIGKLDSQTSIPRFEMGNAPFDFLGRTEDKALHSCTELSHLIYGLSSSYLITGKDRYRLAARTYLDYQREYFRVISHDGQSCFWAFGKRGNDVMVPNPNGEDGVSISVAQQIRVLAGLSQYYRISQDRRVLEDIELTLTTFNQLFQDGSDAGGYFSHLDYRTLTCDSSSLGKKRFRKNWQSNGEHIPAYLVNLILSLDYLAKPEDESIEKLRRISREMLETLTDLLLEKFPSERTEIPYINECFYHNWIQDNTGTKPQNTATIGYNLRMAWTLCRVASYYLTVIERSNTGEPDDGLLARTQQYAQKATRCMEQAESLALKMIPHGLDLLSGGVFDRVKREPQNGQPLEFFGNSTKEYWQQEQGILTYLMLHGMTGKSLYLDIARELSAFWHLFFFYHPSREIVLRTQADGQTCSRGKGGDAVSNLDDPLFETYSLGYLYTWLYCGGKQPKSFCLYFKPKLDLGSKIFNVAPDFVKPDILEIEAYYVNGKQKIPTDSRSFQIDLTHEPSGCDLVVKFKKVG